jgi:hypothetical protein
MSDIPNEFGDQLARLYPGVIMVVPNDLLQAWFPPSVPFRSLDKMEIAAAQAYAAKFGCVFHYSPIAGDCEQGEGRFRKA